jgi:hypothetical protein
LREWYSKESLEKQVNEIKHDVESNKKDLVLNSENLFNSLIDSVNADLVSKKKRYRRKIKFK